MWGISQRIEKGDAYGRHAVHPDPAVVLDTAELQEHLLIQDLFIPGQAKMVYTDYDRKSEVENPQS